VPLTFILNTLPSNRNLNIETIFGSNFIFINLKSNMLWCTEL
jgi:hypothetical protein